LRGRALKLQLVPELPVKRSVPPHRRQLHAQAAIRPGRNFSPILGYLPEEDLVFVGDVNEKYRPWLVPTSRLYDAQNTIDSSSHAKRGVLEIEAP
jgi:hypothetical protein